MTDNPSNLMNPDGFKSLKLDEFERFPQAQSRFHVVYWYPACARQKSILAN